LTLRTILQVPHEELMARALDCSARFRRGEFGWAVRPRHRDAVFLHGPPWPYRIDVWGDPKGRVTVHAHVAPEGGSV
jgi:hypothetical protein